MKVPFASRPSTCPVRAWRAWTEAAGEGYFEDADGWEENAMIGVL
ncbi:hypothetical protein [Streptomyces lydicus]